MLERTKENIIASGFFRKDKDGELYYEVLGRNGEKLPSTTVNFAIYVKQLKTAANYSLDTNSEG